MECGIRRSRAVNDLPSLADKISILNSLAHRKWLVEIWVNTPVMQINNLLLQYLFILGFKSLAAAFPSWLAERPCRTTYRFAGCNVFADT